MPQMLKRFVLTTFLFLHFTISTQAATIVVNSSTDGTGPSNVCELRDAITAANNNSAVDGCSAGIAGPAGDRIEFDLPSPSTITLTAGLPVITQSLEIAGPGIDQLTIDGGDAFPILDADSNTGFLTIRDLEMYQGRRESGGCLYVLFVATVLVEDVRIDNCTATSTSGGGASIISFLAGSSIVIRRVTFKDNSAFQGGGGMNIVPFNAQIEDSVFQGNQATQNGSNGGGLGIGGSNQTVITRSTFAENSADYQGGAIDIYSAGASASISHSTISQNSVLSTSISSLGGAISNLGNLSLLNTVVAGNTEQNPNHSNADLSSQIGSVSTLGFNFIGSNEGATGIFPAGIQANGDRAGTTAEPRDAKLGALADNGGPTLSLMPMAESNLINRGSCPGETRDQRGYRNNATGLRRIFPAPPTPPSDGCDTGAIEYMAQRPEPLFEDGFESP